MAGIIDAFSLNLLSSAFISIAREMGINLLRAAYSSMVREAKDASAALLDRDGNVIAQTTLIPMHMNSMSQAFKVFVRTYDFCDLGPDDAFIMNDPYSGGQHLPDIFLFCPVFYRDELVAFCGSSAHHVDVGGSTPGPCVTATELFQEGIRIPPLKINLLKDLQGGILEELLAANVRVPKQVIGDLNAQVASVRSGQRRMVEVFEKYGTDLVKEGMEEIQNYSERIIRKEISDLPDGVYTGEDYLDSDGISKRSIKIEVSVIVEGSEITIDLSKGNKQVRGPINSPVASTTSTVHIYLAGLWEQTVPQNEGCYRPVKFIIPEGTIFNPNFPAPVRLRNLTVYRLFSALNKAFSKVCPERIVACGNSSLNVVGFGLSEPGNYEVFLEVVGGGLGGGLDYDGADVTGQLMSNCSNIPVEVIENDLSIIRIMDYSMIQDSGGDGRYRGGLGLRRSYQVLKDNVLLSTYSDRFKFASWGLYGGMDAGNSSFTLIKRNGKTMRLPANVNKRLKKDDVFIAEFSGGGGYGAPRDRKPESITHDVEEGKISLEKARSVYGLELASD
jgi:N-methylhydantoinase B